MAEKDGPERKRMKSEECEKFHLYFPQLESWASRDCKEGLKIDNVILDCFDMLKVNDEDINDQSNTWGSRLVHPTPRRDFALPRDRPIYPGESLMVWVHPEPPEPPPKPLPSAAAAKPRPTKLRSAADCSKSDPPLASEDDEPHDVSSHGGPPPCVDPPQCASCFGRSWPVHRNRKGLINCSECSVPIGGRPVCIWCKELTWDGMHTGIGLCKRGKFFICRRCYIKEAQPPHTPEEWSAWFQEREDRYPSVFGPRAQQPREPPPDADSSVKHKDKGIDKGRDHRMSSFEAEDDPQSLGVHPPKCTSCSRYVWPAMKAKSGKWHCGFCKPPPDGRPKCSKCGVLDWDGLSPRGVWLKKGETFVCRGCWIELDDRWEVYFNERHDRYQDVYGCEGGPAITKGDEPFEGCFSIYAEHNKIKYVVR